MVTPATTPPSRWDSVSLPRLSVELVPASAFFQNLRTTLPPEDWDGLRQQCYQKAHYRCEICGGKGPTHPVEAHEVWRYVRLNVPGRGIEHWQILLNIQALCPACHSVKHLGFAEKNGTLPQALAHLARVNQWSPQTTMAYAQEVFQLWRERSQYQWGLDIGWLETIGWHPAFLRRPPEQ